MSTATNENKLRHHAEQQFAEELEELKKSDARQRPANWELSPWAVCTYLLGGELDNGFTVSAKYIGNRRIIETAVATLATDRALLLYGVPGTAKSWVSEHLAAAISGDSTRIIQGTAGTSEEQMRYGWNYAELLSKGPSRAALVESPLMRAMSEGRIARVEELTRIPADVQDTLITILSEKTLPIPELNDEVQAVRGFNLIATANNRDKGVNELSSALKRRFNTVILPVPATEEEEISIVSKRVSELGRALELPAEPPAMHEVRRVVQIFRELRNGQTEDGKTKLKSPTGTMSTAEAISVLNSGMALAAHFGDGVLHARDVAASLVGAVVKDPVQDDLVWREYLETVVKERSDWKDSLSRLPRSGLGKESGRVLFVESSLPRTPYPQKLRPVGRRRKGSWWGTVGVENRPMSAPFPFQPCVCRRKTGFPYARFLRVHPSGGKRSKRRPTVVARRRAHARMSIRGKRLSGKPPSFGGHSSPTVYKRLRHA
ncbi:MAG: AAA family ATPase [Bilophila wadsworthia]|uniref:ATP-binding protein n=2 Tax=Bilophila wadsworthia TaxID=35833 RepID=UPI00300F4C6A